MTQLGSNDEACIITNNNVSFLFFPSNEGFCIKSVKNDYYTYVTVLYLWPLKWSLLLLFWYIAIVTVEQTGKTYHIATSDGMPTKRRFDNLYTPISTRTSRVLDHNCSQKWFTWLWFKMVFALFISCLNYESKIIIFFLY